MAQVATFAASIVVIMSTRLVLAVLLACGVCMNAMAQQFAVGSLDQSYEGWEVVPWETSHVDVSAFVEEYNGNGAFFPSLKIDATDYSCCFQTQFDTQNIFPYDTCAKWRAGCSGALLSSASAPVLLCVWLALRAWQLGT